MSFFYKTINSGIIFIKKINSGIIINSKTFEGINNKRIKSTLLLCYYYYFFFLRKHCFVIYELSSPNNGIIRSLISYRLAGQFKNCGWGMVMLHHGSGASSYLINKCLYKYIIVWEKCDKNVCYMFNLYKQSTEKVALESSAKKSSRWATSKSHNHKTGVCF